MVNINLLTFKASNSIYYYQTKVLLNYHIFWLLKVKSNATKNKIQKLCQ